MTPIPLKRDINGRHGIKKIEYAQGSFGENNKMKVK